MYCTKCGTKNEDDYRFCVKCGTNLQKIDTVNIQKTVKKDTGKFGNVKHILKIAIAIIAIVIIISTIFIFIPKNNVNDNGNTAPNQPTQETVEISISSTPSGANTYVDNVSIGNTPVTIKLPEGNYSLKMNLTGYKSIKSNFNVTSDMARQEINATLEPIN